MEAFEPSKYPLIVATLKVCVMSIVPQVNFFLLISLCFSRSYFVRFQVQFHARQLTTNKFQQKLSANM